MAAGPTPPAPSADAASLPAGYRLFEYEIEAPLGGGGFGITYLARDINLNLPVAIKEYFPSDLVTRAAGQTVQVRGGNMDAQGTYDWGLERFLDEARALATFRHPNIVRVLRYFRENGTAYIVMEYESGQPLKRWVPENAPLSQRALLSIIYPLLDGLESVHKTGFLHRDIKPDNIYVRANGTPVLLDFGAARRVSSNRDMTNIVSPGFAPFEQYHSQGNQGPWTDIYSLGAVMYWMTTGKKPVESAARIKVDSMLPASSLADEDIFGATLLQAIDWAMLSDESRRPQSVALFRAAIQGAERPVGVDLDLGGVVDRAGMTAAGYAPSVPGHPTGSPPSGPSAQRRNLLCTIMFLDLVGYSIRSVDDQVALKKLFNELIGKALKGVAEETRIAIDTGDGAAICFMGDPEEALHSAMLLRDLLGQRYGNNLSVRIGLHMGPVRVIADINDRVNVVGDGINVAQRIMDFAQGNQVLVSRSYYDVISRITDDTADLFQYLGQFEDKHARLHEVYSVESGPRGTDTRKEGPSTGYTQTMPMKAVKPIEPNDIHDIEVELARHIGPLARVLVRKAQPLARNVQDLREALAPSIQEPKAREAFIAGTNSQVSQTQPASKSTTNRTPSMPASGNTQFGSPAAGPRSVPMPSRPSAPSQPLSQPMGRPFSHPLSQPASQLHTQSLTRYPPSRAGDSARQMDIAPDELLIIEQALGKFIGPMAKVLIRKETGRATSFKDFVQAVAGNIDHVQQREEFMAALKRSLPRRQF